MPKLWSQTIEAHRRDVRDAILNTAAALATRDGVRAVTMSGIADEAGIGRATLYRYFPDVEAILRAWHERQISGHLAHLADVRVRGTTSAERLRDVLEAYAVILHESRSHHDTELAALLHRDPQIGTAQEHVLELIRDLVKDAAAAGAVRRDVSPDELSRYCVHALSAAASVSSKAAVRRLVSLTLEALRMSPATGSVTREAQNGAGHDAM